MKKRVYLIALILGLQFSLVANAQQSETISLRIPEFARPLVEKWTNDYQQHHASVNFEFIKGKTQNASANVLELTTDDEAVSFARYAILPVTIKDSEAARLTSHRFNAKRLRSLFFVNDDDEEEESKAEQKIHIYTGNSQLSASRAYALFLNQEVSNYKGKKISGDDAFLTAAISRDPLGVTVNYLSNIFDLESRQPGSSLALLPLDLDKHGRQVLDAANLDEIISLLEEQKYDVIPVGTVGFMYDHTDSAINDFVNWVLTAGVCDLHQYGMLTLSQKELTAQMQRIAGKDLAQK
ncbi:MAG: hypothetical protein IKZ89_08180 [Bacteroidaceae bacterium]|nr:hypothetical protein [Bacteroidaceae bacterium]